MWLLSGALVLAMSGSAHATSLRPGSDTSLPYAEWIAESQMPTPNVRVWVWREACPAFETPTNCTNWRTIWLNPAEENPHWAFLHELGHVFDHWVLRRADRAAYRQLAGHAGAWRHSPFVREDFAEDYYFCAAGDTRLPGWGTPAVCDFIERVAE